MSNKFKREERYIVVKLKHLAGLQVAPLRNFLRENRVPTIDCVVVEADWPEYEPVWQMIERRVTGATEPPQPETVPKFKFDTLVQHCKRLEADIAQARAHVNEITLYQQNAVWFWQHDGEDFLESLSCPIIIQPHHLRELIAGAKPTKCAWTYSENGFNWDTQCGQKWSFTDGGTPTENGMNFCHSCGKGLTFVEPEGGDE